MPESYDGWSRERLTSRLASLESILKDLGVPTERNAGLVADAAARLTSTEGRILVALSDGNPRTKEELHRSIYQFRDVPPRMKTVDVLICNIRKKLQPTSLRILTVDGRAYQLAEAASVQSPARSPSAKHNASSMSAVLAHLRDVMQASGFCRAMTREIVAGSGIKGDLHAVMHALVRRRMVIIHERPTAKARQQPWIIYIRARARG